ncbi:purine and uridine phosphorylase [Aspergillus venezuelensis]
MRPISRNNFAIAIICALPLEADAVEALFDEHYDRLGKYYGKQQGDANAYINGRIGKHDLVLCYMPGMGKGSAAGVASSLQVSYPGIELTLVVGICGGAPSPPDYQELFLGDVIISDSTGVKDTLGRPGREIRTLSNGLRAENARIELQRQIERYLHTLHQRGAKWCHPGVSDILFRAAYLHKYHNPSSLGRCSCLGCGSADQICEEALVKDCNDLDCDSSQHVRRRESGQHRDEIARREKVIGFEMEGAGGVCDYADSHKSKLWQAYAAATGASVAKAFLEYWMPPASQLVFRNIPFPRNKGFVGRGEQLNKLEELLFSPGCQRKVAITGLEGVGKTQLALEYTYQIQQTRPKCSIYWISATNFEMLEQTYFNITQQLQLPGLEGEGADAKKLLKEYLCADRTGQWLLIYNNVGDMSMTGSVLFTTRFKKIALKLAMQNVIMVPEMDEAKATKLLERSSCTTSQAALLLKQLVHLPLAIVQAASYINENCPSTLSAYLLLLSEKEEEVNDLLSEEFKDDWQSHDTTSPVATTWLISFERIQRTNQLATDILSFMACIEPTEIPKSLLPPATSHKTWLESVGILEGYAFVKRQSIKSFDLHRLVHLATRKWLRNNNTLAEWSLKTLSRLDEIFPDNNYTNRDDEVQHITLRYKLLYKDSMCLLADGRATEAVKYLEEHYNWHKRKFDEEHPSRLASQHGLARAYQANGQIKQAVELLQHVVAYIMCCYAFLSIPGMMCEGPLAHTEYLSLEVVLPTP